MQTANLATFVKTVFYIIVFYYLIKIAFRLFFPMVVKAVVRKAEEGFQEHNRRQQAQGEQQPQKPDKRRETKIVGEYIDYEEIE